MPLIDMRLSKMENVIGAKVNPLPTFPSTIVGCEQSMVGSVDVQCLFEIPVENGGPLHLRSPQPLALNPGRQHRLSRHDDVCVR
jgi:hypothetical protein